FGRLSDLDLELPVEDLRVLTFRVLRRVPLHPQVLWAAEGGVGQVGELLVRHQLHVRNPLGEFLQEDLDLHAGEVLAHALVGAVPEADRKSTRLNSSHVKISYAVFCLKKKK